MNLLKSSRYAIALAFVATEAGAVLFPPCRPPIDGAPAEALSVQILVPSPNLHQQRFGTAISDALEERGLTSKITVISDPNMIFQQLGSDYNLNVVVAPVGMAEDLWGAVDANSNSSNMIVSYSGELDEQFKYTANDLETNFLVEIQRPDSIENVSGDYLRGYLVGDSIGGVMVGENITNDMFLQQFQSLDGFNLDVQGQ